MNVYFDVAYNQALTISIFAMIFVFSTSVPIILPFGAMYFFLKYTIDKYNIVWVYPLEFESHGYLRQTVWVFMVISIGINQLFLIGFLLSLNKESFKAAAFLIAFTMAFCSWYILSKKPWVPYKQNKNRNNNVIPKGSIKVFNKQKYDVEIVEDIAVDISEAKKTTSEIVRNVLSWITLCQKWRQVESSKLLKQNNEMKTL